MSDADALNDAILTQMASALASAKAENELLQARVEQLLRANTEQVERRRVIERKLLESQWDAQGWQRLYYEEHEKVERYEAQDKTPAGVMGVDW